jgi:hypothetical protein
MTHSKDPSHLVQRIFRDGVLTGQEDPASKIIGGMFSKKRRDLILFLDLYSQVPAIEGIVGVNNIRSSVLGQVMLKGREAIPGR